MKKVAFVLAGLAALSGLGYLGTDVGAQEGVKHAGGADNKPTLKIGVINIAAVIKKFEKANVLGDQIIKDATRYENELKKEQEALKAEEGRLGTLPTEAEKEALKRSIRERYNALQDKDQAYQKDIRKRRDDMAVEINSNIQRIIDSLARHHGFEMVLTCPDVPDVKEIGTLSDAMRRMTAPAVWVAWKHPQLDITDECVTWLNHYFKPPAGSAPVTPTSGTK